MTHQILQKVPYALFPRYIFHVVFDFGLVCHGTAHYLVGTNQFILPSNPLLMHFIMICKKWNWFLNLSSLWIYLYLLSCLTTFVKDMRPEVTCMLPFNLSKMAGYLWTSFSLCVMFPLLNSCISSQRLHIPKHYIWTPDARKGGIDWNEVILT